MEEVEETKTNGENVSPEEVKEAGESGDVKKPQSREENHEYAERRRAEKAKSEEIERAKKEATFEAKKGFIPKDTLDELGLDSLEDENDLYIAEEYEKAKREGDENPKARAYRALYLKSREEAKQKAEAEKAKAESTKEAQNLQSDFEKKHGVSLTSVISDTSSGFMQEVGRFVGGGSLSEYYKNFDEAYTAYEKRTAEAEAGKKAKAKELGSSFVTKDGSAGAVQPDVSKMTREQFDAYFRAKYGG